MKRLAPLVASCTLACASSSPPASTTTSAHAAAPPAAEPVETQPLHDAERPRSMPDSASPSDGSSRGEAAPPPQVAELPVPGFLPAVVVVPAGEDERPLLVAAHGAGGAPEWDCEYWKRLTAGHAFVLCLRGTAMGGGSFYYRQHHALRDELEAATLAARTAFPRIAARRGVYAGFSQGASMGSLVVAHQGAQFAYAILLEGFAQWDVALSRAFARGGGEGVLWVCGTPGCATKAERSAQAATRGGLKARAEHVVGAGHTPLGEVQAKLVQNLPWLLGEDPLWQPILK